MRTRRNALDDRTTLKVAVVVFAHAPTTEIGSRTNFGDYNPAPVRSQSGEQRTSFGHLKMAHVFSSGPTSLNRPSRGDSSHRLKTGRAGNDARPSSANGKIPFHRQRTLSVIKLSSWQRRIHRAVELSRQYPAAAEILAFYIHVAEFQQEWHHRVSLLLQSSSSLADASLSPAELAELLPGFDSFLSMAKERGPAPLAERIRELRAHARSAALLAAAWQAASPSNAEEFLAQAFLQPYAELLRSRAKLRSSPTIYALCPYCHRKPSFGVLRPMGEGSARSLICSFCLAEWEFRRLVCPGCGEENDKKLPIFTAEEFDYIRVECCDTCKTYIKAVDLTRNGRAEPVVDELASAPLDLWAHEHGYAKLQSNMLGM